MRDAHPVHPPVVRVTHWLLALAGSMLVGSGLQIFGAFSSFGGQAPERDLFSPPDVARIGGALQLHVVFAWLFIGAGLVYVVYQLTSGNYRQVLFTVRDVRGVWPMIRHYLLVGPKPPQRGTYNALQKLAYTTVIGLGAWLVGTGVVLYKPALFSPMIAALGGFRLVRISHVVATCGVLAFVPVHLVMVALQGWKNFASMWTGASLDSPRVHNRRRSSTT